MGWRGFIFEPMKRAVWIGMTLVLGTECLALSQGEKITEPPASVGASVDFVRDIQPILETRCTVCHGSQTQMSELRLDRKESVLKGGLSGKPAIVPGQSNESLLIRYVSGLDPKIVMPPNGERLTPAQIKLLKSWIDQGAIWPETPHAETGSSQTPKQHWSFQPIRRPEVPAVKRTDWIRTPIDNFVLAQLEKRGWTPSPPADSRALLRRVYLDLIGLPPTPTEQELFSKSPTAESLDGVVDDLLSRSSYGERWARHWLDLVRYAETNGYERDSVKPFVWRYRDYVIQSFNNDKPYDQFILEQLAGDELPGSSAETLVATGFYRLGPWDEEPADKLQDHFDQLDDVVSTTSQVFLGLTLGCARCHDHKFDPLTARDYYRMVAVFRGLERPREGRVELDLPLGTAAEVDAEARRDKPIGELKKQIAESEAGFRAEFLKSGKTGLPPEALEALLVEPGNRTEVQMVYAQAFQTSFDKLVAAALPTDLKEKTAPLHQKIEAIRKSHPDLPRGYFLHEKDSTPPATCILSRGQASQPAEEVTPGVPAILVSREPEFAAGNRTSLRRLTLANWLTSPENPLTARVIVNRVWQFHFGQGLVRTPSDFGRMGERPTHPELLDWLASWFVKEGWSFKKLHRLILASNTYRMSQWNAEHEAQDPENRLLWRFPSHRLEVEAIRDSMLAVSGQLNRKMYGPSMYPYIPEAALQSHKEPEKAWHAFDEEEASRRTIYAHIKRSLVVPMLEVLDFCDTTRSSANRLVTSVAPQALTLFNGEDVNRQARHLARRLVNDVGSDPRKQIDRGYRLALCRPPSASEEATMLQFLDETARSLTSEAEAARDALARQDARQKALEQMCRAIFNLNEFVYAD